MWREPKLLVTSVAEDQRPTATLSMLRLLLQTMRGGTRPRSAVVRPCLLFVLRLLLSVPSLFLMLAGG